MPEKIEDFAKRIKGKYKEYADVDDYELVEKMVRKYPSYASEVELPSGFRLLKTSTGYQNLLSNGGPDWITALTHERRDRLHRHQPDNHYY